MKNLKMLLTALLTFSITTTSIAPVCAETTGSNEQDQEEQKQPILVSEAQMYVGIPKKMEVQDYEGEVQWISENTDIAMVDADGTVRPLKSGNTEIKAIISADLTLVCHVNVRDVSIILNSTNLGSVYIGDTRNLKASVEPETSIQWSSSNPAVAKVDSFGNVTALAAGNAIIYASANGINAQCAITVMDKTISIDRSSAVLYEGDRIKLNATGSPTGTPSWRSDNTAVAVVDASGNVTAKASGTTTIRASMNGKIAVVQITVKAIKVSLNKQTLTMYLGYKEKLDVTYEPKGSPFWSSDNTRIVSVDQNGNLTPKAVGQTKVRVKVNGKTALATITVKKPFVKFASSSKTLYKGETYKPTISYGPTKGSAKWSISKSSVVKVNSKGQITAVKAGTAYITVRINGKSAKLKVTVKNPITLKKPSVSVKKASRASLKISWKKVSGANQYYVYRSFSKNGKKYKIATVKGTSYTHKYIPGKQYYYNVRAASTNKYKYKVSGYSTTKTGRAADTVTVSTPYINQIQGGAVQGCEGASLLMALKAKGYTNMEYKQFLNGMPKSKNNPKKGFIYSMYSNNPTNQVHWIDTPALAVYGKKFGKVEDISGASIGKLKYELHRNRPIIVYVTAMFGTPQWKRYSYGSIPKNLHVVTLVGYNGRTGKYKINDPYFGVLWINKGQFESVYNSMKKAVVVR